MMRLEIVFPFLFLAFSAHASEQDRRNIMLCEQAAVLVTSAYTTHPARTQDRIDFINEEKARISNEDPDSSVEDRHLMPAFTSVIFQLVELKVLDSEVPLSVETQIRLAARAGATCGLLSGIVGVP